MTINFYDALNGDGLFNVLGRVFAAQAAVNTARGTTVPNSVANVLTQFQNVHPDAERNQLATSIPGSLVGYQDSAGGLMSSLQDFSRAFLVDFVHRDATLPQKTLPAALTELVRQMGSESESVDRSTVTAIVTAGGSNVGTGIVLAGIYRGDGQAVQAVIPESVTAKLTSGGVNGQVLFQGGPSTSSLSQDWPDGSGASVTVSSVDSVASGYLTNGGFDTFTSNVPDGWIAYVATPGTTIYGTTVEVQTVAITGTPTGGYYQLKWTDPNSKTFTTAAIAYNATASAVQTALRAIPGLESVTVTSTGTTPDFTHEVTFLGQGGDINQLTSVNKLTGGSTPAVTHATTTSGTPYVMRGSRSLVFDSNGSELTAIYQKVSGLVAGTIYCCSLWAAVDVVPAAGVIKVELVDDIGGNVLSYCQFNAADLAIAFQHISEVTATPYDCYLTTPAILPPSVYLRIRISTAVSSGTSVFLDEAVIAPAVPLYTGGPFVSVITGKTNWQLGDSHTIAVTNNRAGLIQEWFERNFNMSSLGLLLPSNGAGAETIPDSVVA